LDHLLDVALKMPGMHISCPDGHLATEESRRDGGLCIRFRSKVDSEGSSAWARDYTPGTFTPLAEAADNYPEGGRDGFVGWLKDRCRIETREVGSGILSGVLYYEPLWRAFLQRLMADVAQDGIRWLELR
jgi:adenosine deaminase CECR1